MESVAALVAPIATAIAAMMTAVNLGARITGWGFVVFTIGSIGWCVVGLSTGQTNLLLTNGFLTLVNLVGIWRWLGRQAKVEDEGKAAVDASDAADAPALLTASALDGIEVRSADGEKIGTGVEAMIECATGALSYLVVRSGGIGGGGIGGAGERLTAVERGARRFACDAVTLTLPRPAFDALPEWRPSAGA